jgi:NADH dehydrogenase
LRRAPVRVILIDRSNHHLFQPLLYQVATAALNPSDIASPIRRILRHQRNAEVLLAEVRAVDVEGKRVVLADGEVSYDALIVATGRPIPTSATTTGSGSPRDSRASTTRWRSAGGSSRRSRRRARAGPTRQRAWMTFVIVGAGPTGVELAGTLAEVARHTLARDFRHIDPTRARVILLEGTPRVLPMYVEELSAKARAQLDRLGSRCRRAAS